MCKCPTISPDVFDTISTIQFIEYIDFLLIDFYSAPGLAWDACLKETKQYVQLLHDYDILMMFEKGIRGGISHISKRYSEANNKYMENYDSGKPSKFITYLDGYPL